MVAPVGRRVKDGRHAVAGRWWISARSIARRTVFGFVGALTVVKRSERNSRESGFRTAFRLEPSVTIAETGFLVEDRQRGSRDESRGRADNGPMDAPSLTAARSKELADLRRRAYGPNADIDSDPAAQHRLHELEELARPSASEAPPRLDPHRDGHRRGSSPAGAPDGDRSEALSSVAVESAPEAPDEEASEVPDPAAPAPARRGWQRVPWESPSGLPRGWPGPPTRSRHRT